MQKLAIYSAHSLVDVITHLASARPSGVLTIWCAADPQREEASLLVEAGQLLRLRWGSYEGEVTEDLLHQLTLWGDDCLRVSPARDSTPAPTTIVPLFSGAASLSRPDHTTAACPCPCLFLAAQATSSRATATRRLHSPAQQGL